MSSDSKEVIFAMNSSEVILCFTLGWRSHCLESGKSARIVNALFKEVQLRLTDTHLTIHLEHALSSIIERIVTDGLEL